MAECFRCKTMVSETMVQCPQCLVNLRCGRCESRFTTQAEADDHPTDCAPTSQVPAGTDGPVPDPKAAAQAVVAATRQLFTTLCPRWLVNRPPPIQLGRLLGHAYFQRGVAVALSFGLIMLILTCAGPSRKFSGTWNLQSELPGHQAKLVIRSNKTIQLIEIGSGSMAGQYYTDETLKWYPVRGQANPTIGFKPTSAATLDMTLTFLNARRWSEIFDQTGKTDEVYPSEIRLELLGDGDQLLLFAVYGTAKSNQPLMFDSTRPSKD